MKGVLVWSVFVCQMWDSSCESWVLVHRRVKSHTVTSLSHLTLLTSLWTDVVVVSMFIGPTTGCCLIPRRFPGILLSGTTSRSWTSLTLDITCGPSESM